MLIENLSCERNCFLCRNSTVGPNFNGKLIIVGDLPYAGVFNRIINLLHRCVDRVDSNNADNRLHHLLVSLCGNITSASVASHLHAEICAF